MMDESHETAPMLKDVMPACAGEDVTSISDYGPRYSIIVPAHNEEKRISGALDDISSAIPSAEIIVVANNCTDGTVEVVQRIAAVRSNIRLVNLQANTGKGGAVRAGFQVASGEVTAFVDADGATSGAELKRLIECLGDADCVIASRWVKGADVEIRQTLLRRIMGRGFNFIIKVLFGLGFADTQCGAKIFKRNALAEILEHVETADFAFDVDVLYQLHRHGKRVQEIPTVWRDRPGSSVNVRRAVPKMLASVVRLRLKHSAFRILVPLLDRLAQLRPIIARRCLNVLIVSPNDPRESPATEMERRLQGICVSLQGGRRNFTWCVGSTIQKEAIPTSGIEYIALGRARLARVLMAFKYLTALRDRYDCIVEVCPNSRLWWTPLFSLKPKLVIAPALRMVPELYRTSTVIRGVPESAEAFDGVLMEALATAGSTFCSSRDGTWVLLERLSGRMLAVEKTICGAGGVASHGPVNMSVQSSEPREVNIC